MDILAERNAIYQINDLIELSICLCRPNRKHIYYEPLLNGSCININHAKKVFKAIYTTVLTHLKWKKKIGINKLYGKPEVVKKRNSGSYYKICMLI